MIKWMELPVMLYHSFQMPLSMLGADVGTTSGVVVVVLVVVVLVVVLVAVLVVVLVLVGVMVLVGCEVEGVVVVVAGAINCTVVDPRAVCFTHPKTTTTK
jgi:hypothetical protein